MRNIQAGRANRISPRVRAWVAIFCLFLVTVILGKAVWNIYNKNHLAEQNKETTLRELADLEERQARIGAKLERLKTDQGKEEEIRNNLPVAKEGEHVIVIVESEEKTAAQDQRASSSTKPGFWAALVRSIRK